MAPLLVASPVTTVRLATPEKLAPAPVVVSEPIKPTVGLVAPTTVSTPAPTLSETFTSFLTPLKPVVAPVPTPVIPSPVNFAPVKPVPEIVIAPSIPVPTPVIAPTVSLMDFLKPPVTSPPPVAPPTLLAPPAPSPVPVVPVNFEPVKPVLPVMPAQLTPPPSPPPVAPQIVLSSPPSVNFEPVKQALPTQIAPVPVQPTTTTTTARTTTSILNTLKEILSPPTPAPSVNLEPVRPAASAPAPTLTAYSVSRPAPVEPMINVNFEMRGTPAPEPPAPAASPGLVTSFLEGREARAADEAVVREPVAEPTPTTEMEQRVAKDDLAAEEWSDPALVKLETTGHDSACADNCQWNYASSACDCPAVPINVVASAPALPSGHSWLFYGLIAAGVGVAYYALKPSKAPRSNPSRRRRRRR